MRKVVLLVACMLCMASCAVKESSDAKMVKVMIKVGGVHSGTMGTRATASDVESAIHEGAPDLTGLPLVIAVGNSVKQYAKVGDVVTLLEGEYRFYCQSEDEEVMKLGGYGVYESPSFVFDAQVDVAEGMTEVIIPASYTCWALALDYSELESVVLDGNEEDVSSKEGIGLLYVSTEDRGSAWDLRVIPRNLSKYKAVDYRISGNEAGKWYYYGPKGRVDVGGMLQIGLPDWEYGGGF